MSELSADARAALRAARRGYEPSAEQLARLEQALLALVATVPPSPAPPSLVQSKLGLGAKAGLKLVALAIAAGGVGLWLATQPRTTTPTARTAPPAEVASAPVFSVEMGEPSVVPLEPAPPSVPSEHSNARLRPQAGGWARRSRASTVQAVNAADAPSVPAADAPLVPPPEPVAVQQAASQSQQQGETSERRAVTLQPRSSPTPQVARPADLDAEVAQLARAHAALASDDAAAALRRIMDYLRDFPRGLLREEALATRVLCLCTLSRSHEAQRALHALQELAPHSTHLPRIRAACRALIAPAEDR